MVKVKGVYSKIQASTLLEVIISMIIILLVFSIAMMIFVNVTRSSLSVKKLRAEALVNEVMIITEKSNKLEDQSFEKEGTKIEVTVSSSSQAGLHCITISAYDENHQKIFQSQKLIIDQHE